MLGMVVNAYFHFNTNTMEAYLTPERETLIALMERAGIEVVENAALCRPVSYTHLTLPTTPYV